MRSSGSRGARAKRRSAKQHTSDKAPTPAGWPEGERLAEALDVNALAAKLLEDIEPETVRLILQRMEPKARKALFEPRNVPLSKVSLRAAGQVLGLLRAEEKPAESTLLGAMLSPAAVLFNDATIGEPQVTGLRLRLVDLALPLITHSESTFQGLRTWHRWADESFEDLTLAVVIGLKCSHAALAGAYLAASHPDLAERYEQLRGEFPAMPPAAAARLTPSNPLTRYLAGRPDRRLPASTVELRSYLFEDEQMRRAELEQAQRGRPDTETEPGDEDQFEVEETPESPAPRQRRPVADVEPVPEPTDLADDVPGGPEQPALPDVAEWASAVNVTQRVTEHLTRGLPPELDDMWALIGLSIRLLNMAKLLSRVMGVEVPANRGEIDRALTIILSDPELKQRLGEPPATVADVAAALRRLPPEAPEAPAAAEAAPKAPVADADDLSDLDSLLDGNAGAQLAAVAGTKQGAEEPRPAEPEPSSPEPETTEDTAGKAPETVAEPEKDEVLDLLDDQPRNTAVRMVAVAMAARHPGGPLAEAYGDMMIILDREELAADPQAHLFAAAAALPMALIDNACGAVDLLSDRVEGLEGMPRLLEFRSAINELAMGGIGLYDADLRALTFLMDRWHRTSARARQIRESADTRTLKYDKATKVYRKWLAPKGRLRGLVDAIADERPMKEIQSAATECRRVGAARAVDDTVAAEFGAGRTRIVAGARKTLMDTYDDVLRIATDVEATAAEIAKLHAADRSTQWKYTTVEKFRERCRENLQHIEAEIEGPACPHPIVYGMALRAMSLAVSPLPMLGPEISVAAASRVVQTEPPGSPE